METLTELVARISTDATELKKGLSDAEGATEKSSKNMADSLKKVGMAMAASGAAITAAIGFMGKAAIDEGINIKRLAISLKNVGVNYDDVKDSLEGVIAATQRKTGIADNEQRDALNELITVTGSYETALTWLQPSLDMAAAKQMDATSAARLLGRAAIGSTEMLTRYGIIIDKDATAAEILTEVQNKFGGAAEATANPLKVLSAAIGDVSEVIGDNLVPIIKGLSDKIVDIAEKVQAWAKEHPELAKVITLVATGLGILLTVVGGLILILPGLIAGIAAFGVVFHAALGPIGLISIAITALIAGGILLWQNWDTVSHFFADIWSNMKNAALHAIDSILTGLEHLVGWLPILGNKVDESRDKIANMIEAENVKRDLRDVEESLNDTKKIIIQTTDSTVGLSSALKENQITLELQKAQLEQQIESYTNYKNSIDAASIALSSQGDVITEVQQKLSQFGGTSLSEQEMKNVATKLKSLANISPSSAIDFLRSEYPELLTKAQDMVKGMKAGGETYFELEDALMQIIHSAVPGLWSYSLPDIRGYASGGTVPGPIGAPQLAMVHGGETILRANESAGGITINFTQPVFFDREDQMNRFVDMIRKGIQRQDRIQFGRAYNG